MIQQHLTFVFFQIRGLQSKRIARLEHQLSMNIKETQHRIVTEVAKDMSFLRRILNEANLMKFTVILNTPLSQHTKSNNLLFYTKPVYTDSNAKESFNSLRRRSSCPQISAYRSERLMISRKRAYSENCGQFRQSSTTTLNRSKSDGDLSRIDRIKTFEGSGSLFETNDLLSNVLTALGSIRQIDEDVQSFLELGTNSGLDEQPDSSYEWTSNGTNSNQIEEYMKQNTKNHITSMLPSKLESINHYENFTIQVDSEKQTETRKKSFMSKINPFKGSRKYSVTSQDNSAEKYLENTSKGRESRLSLSHLTCENMELLENTTIADLIRAIEGEQTKSKFSPETPLLDDYEESSKIKIGTNVPTQGLRRGSLRPTHDYTTIFTSQNMNRRNSSILNREPTTVSRSFPANLSSMTTPKRTTQRIRSTSSSIPTVQEHDSYIQSLSMLHRTSSLRPTPLNAETISQMPMITVQAPNVSRTNLLWHPDGNESTLKNNIRRK